MAEEFFMFDSVDGDRLVTAEDFAKYFHEMITNGVFYRNNAPSLKVIRGSGLENTVEVGAAFVEGYMYRNTSPITLLHATGNPSFPRIDRVVIRLNRNLAKRDVRIFIKEGVPATSPIAPTLERNDIVYELSLAQVRVNAGASTVATINDERLNESICGVVNALAELPTDIFLANMEDFQTELNAQLASVIQTSQDEWDTFIGSIQSEAPALGGMTISVQSTAPAIPSTKDIWIDTT